MAAIEKIQFRISFLCGDKEYFSIEDLAEAISNGLTTSNIRGESLEVRTTPLINRGQVVAKFAYGTTLENKSS